MNQLRSEPKDYFSSCGYAWNLISKQEDRELTNNMYTLKFSIENFDTRVHFSTHVKNIVLVITEVINYIQRKHSIYQSFGVIIDHSTLTKPIILPLQKFSSFNDNVLINELINYYFIDKKIMFNGVVTLRMLVCRFFKNKYQYFS
jgi:hypothetical protein